MDAVSEILRACDRLRRLPEVRWQQAPRAPLGAQREAAADGPDLQSRALEWIAVLMRDDAAARQVSAFSPSVTAFGLPDVLAVLAKSVSARDPSAPLLGAAARELTKWC